MAFSTVKEGARYSRSSGPLPPCPRQLSNQMVLLPKGLLPTAHTPSSQLFPSSDPCPVPCEFWQALLLEGQRIRQAQPLTSTAWGYVTLGKEFNLSELETTVVAVRLLERFPVGTKSPLLSFLSHHPAVTE